MSNRLANEKSPYLQQHANNPVDWYPWGDEAFARAKAEDKPIFLSIGYSTCHWCHVMEHESFEDDDVASLMNELYVCIKVDREERPDVDQVYMTAAQALSGGGGWPLNAWLTPDRQPYYVGTYFPPRPAYGRPSFANALRQLHSAWTHQREKVLNSASEIATAISTLGQFEAPEKNIDHEGIEKLCFNIMSRMYDADNGGFGSAPKFPRPVMFEFLLAYHHSDKNPWALDMVTGSLDAIGRGGIYDHLGGGFSRYSVDAEWRVPHFEKMLYDQGQLLMAYADAYRLTKNESYKQTIEQTIGYLERDLLSPEGAFYCGEDADSEGHEGTFYVWTTAEAKRILSDDEASVAIPYFGITDNGNFEGNTNVLYEASTIEDAADDAHITVDVATNLIESARTKLFNARALRPRPSRDEKILTAWNGLVISGLSRAASALGRSDFADHAIRAADAILTHLIVDGQLMRRMKDGEVRFDAYLEDYAFLIQGLLDLYAATMKVEYLQHAELLTQQATELFYDETDGAFFMTNGRDATVLVRSKSDHDGAEPSGSSVMALNLIRLGRLLNDEQLTTQAGRTIDVFLARNPKHPEAIPLMVAASILQRTSPRQAVIAASADEVETINLLRAVQADYAPDLSIYLVPMDGVSNWLGARAPLLSDMKPLDGSAAVYLCENFICHAPSVKWG